MQLNYFISFFVLLLLSIVSADISLGALMNGEGSGSGEEPAGAAIEEEPLVLKSQGLLGSYLAPASAASNSDADGSGIEASGEDVQTFFF